jgi:hypothetical protein
MARSAMTTIQHHFLSCREHRATEAQSRKRKRRSRQSLFLSFSVSLCHNKSPNVACSDLE